jgi:hypothetical protein
MVHKFIPLLDDVQLARLELVCFPFTTVFGGSVVVQWLSRGSAACKSV